MPDLRHIAISLAFIAGALLLALAVQRVIATVGQRASQRKTTPLFQALVAYGVESTRLILPLLALLLIIPWLKFDPIILAGATHAVGLALIAVFG